MNSEEIIMKLILAIVRPFKVPEILDAVEADSAFPGMTVLDCRGFGREKAVSHRHVLPLAGSAPDRNRGGGRGRASMTRASPWRTPFAQRTYAAGVLWATGVVAAWLTGAPDQAGWLAIRLDLAGLFYTAGSLVGAWNFAGAGLTTGRLTVRSGPRDHVPKGLAPPSQWSCWAHKHDGQRRCALAVPDYESRALPLSYGGAPVT